MHVRLTTGVVVAVLVSMGCGSTSAGTPDGGPGGRDSGVATTDGGGGAMDATRGDAASSDAGLAGEAGAGDAGTGDASTCAEKTGPTGAGSGSIYWVAATGGSAAADCAAASGAADPGSYLRTIAAGLACLAGGDTLRILPATYVESIDRDQVPSGTSWDSATVIEGVGTKPVLRPDTGPPIAFTQPMAGVTKRYIVFRNLDFDAGGRSSPAISLGGGGNGGVIDHVGFENIIAHDSVEETLIFFGGGQEGDANGSYVRDSIVHDGGGFTDHFLHGIYIEASDVIIERTEFYNIGGYAIHQYVNPALGDTARPRNNVYRYNFIHDVGNAVSTTFAIIASRGMNTVVHDNVLVRNRNGISLGGDTGTVIYSNVITGSGVGVANCAESADFCYPAVFAGPDTVGAVFRNNIVYGNRDNSVVFPEPSTFTCDHNLCETAGECCDLVGDPMFVDPTSDDFHLRAASPAIDAGTTSIASAITLTCFAGTAPDIGAFEAD